jgi:PKHD-type hydroxylase
MYVIDFLNDEELQKAKTLFSNLHYLPGKTTEGLNTNVKHCNTADLKHESYKEIYNYFSSLYPSKKEFGSIYAFKDLTLPYPVQYMEGMFYDYHVDELEMNGVRSDYSMTLFLSNPDEYDGGELVLKQGDVITQVKLPAGKAILYDTGIVHKVNPVTRGTRNVILFWAQSIFKDSVIREHCVKLAKTIQHFSGIIPENEKQKFSELEQSRINLMRHYADI